MSPSHEAPRDPRGSGEHRFQRLIEHSLDIILMLDAAGKVRYASPSVRRLLGRDPEASVGTDALEVVHRDDASRARRFLAERAPIPGVAPVIDLRVRHADGSWRLLELLANNLLDDPAIGAIVVSARDITEWAAAEARVRESELRLRMVFEQMPAVAWTTDTDLRFTSGTGSGLKALGVTADQLQGVSLTEYFQTEDPTFEPLAKHRAALRGESGNFTITWGGRQYETYVEPLRAADGTITGTVGLALDVTDRERLEEQLRHSQKLEAVGQLTGGIAHDFNNLLTVILTNVELLSTGLPQERDDLRGDLDEIRRAARRGSEMVRKLLGFSRREMLVLRPVGVADVVAEFARTIERMLPEHIAVHVEPIPEGLAVQADEAALGQILMNLATNARDAMSSGGTLTMSAGRAPLPEDSAEQGGRGRRDYVRLTVRDTGVGMSAEVRARAFEPFFTTKPPPHGTGLGLAMIYGLARQQEGVVQIESELGAGTAVHVYFRAAASGATRRSSGPKAVASALSGTETVLIVEDEAAIRHATRRLLEKSGYRVLEAADGTEALDLFRTEEAAVDLILCDAVMPKLGGRGVLDALRREGKSVPFILTSGHIGREAQGALALEPGIPFLSKPWNAVDLLTQVRTLLDAS